MALPVPPTREEQEAIVEHIRSEAGKIERAVNRLEREVGLLREYNTRLVADVVTGKLDVPEAATNLLEEATSSPVEKDAELSMDTATSEQEVAL